MRILLFILFALITTSSFAQFNYDCHNQTNQVANWKFLGPVNTLEETPHQRFGAVTCLSVNPKDSNELFVGSPTGALMHTTNRGATWQSLTDNMDIPLIGVNDIIVNYDKSPYEILLATGSQNEWYDTPHFGIFKSKDGGKTWNHKRTNTDNVIFEPAYYKFKKIENEVFCISRNCISYSSNNGEDWKKIIKEDRVLDGLPLREKQIRHFVFEPSQRTIYFSTKQKYTSKGNENGKLYSYSLSNKSFKNLTPLLNKAYQSERKNNGIEAIQIIQHTKEELLFVVSHNSSEEVYTYTYNLAKAAITDYEVPNGGRLSGGSVFWFHGTEINRVNDRVRYHAGVYLYKSIDGGQTYKQLFGYSLGDNNVPHVDIKTMLITKHSKDGLSDHIYLGTDGGISFSNNGGKSFKNLNGKELQLTQFYGLGSSPFNGIVSAGSQDNSIISFLPKEDKWIYNIRGDGYDVAYSKIKPGLAYGQYNSRMMYSTLKDVVPFYKSVGIKKENSNNRKTIVAHKNGDVFFAGQNLFHLPKNSKKWKEYKTPLPYKALTIAVSEQNPKLIYMSGLWGGLVKSTDGGQTWKDLSNDLVIGGFKQSSRIQSICVSPYDENKVWLGFGYLGAYDKLCKSTVRIIESNDGGKTWTNNSSGLPVFAIQDIQFYEGSYESLFAATDKGVYFKRGNGYKWQLFNQQLPNCLIGELNINYCRGKLLAATYGRGLWETDLPVIEDKNPLIIRGRKEFTAPEGEVLVINQDITLKGKSILSINCPVYMAKGSKIKAKRKSQVQLGPKGKLINGCGDDWLGIKTK